MKKNWINFLGCIAIGLAIFTSCNDDNVDPIIDDGDPEVTGEAMFSALINNLPTDLTSSANDGITRAANDEVKVTDIRVILFNPNGVIQYSWDMGVRYNPTDGFFGPDVSGSGTDNFTTTARLVEYQDYEMVVLVNASDELRAATEVGKSKTHFEEAHVSSTLSALIGQASGINDNTKSYRFYMSNADSYIPVDKDDDLYPTKDEAEEYPVQLKVERAVAKVMVKNGLPTTGLDYEIASLSWKLDITNRKTYWMRKPDKTAGGKNGGDNETSSTLDVNRYAKDPNFTGKSGGSGLDTEFNYITTTEVPTTAVQTWGDGFWEYAMENTMEPDEQKQDVTTRVIVKANYVPKNDDITGGTITTGQSYYTYMGYYITQTQMATYQNDASEIPEHYPLLHKAIQDAKDAGHTLSGSGPTASFSTSSGLNFYKDGISYYKILIRHFEQVSTIMGYGRYGVVRNNLYEVTIKSFSGAGDVDIPGTGDPDPDPDEEYENWVAAEVTIKPWQTRRQGNDL